MGRSQLLLSIFLLLPLLFSVGHGAAPSFHDIWNLVLPHSASPTAAAAVPDHFPHDLQINGGEALRRSLLQGSMPSPITWRMMPDYNASGNSHLKMISNVNTYFPEINTVLHVRPDMYGDNQVHFYVTWTADNYGRTGCFNLRCPGFVVQEGSSIVPGSILASVTQMRISIRKNSPSGDWQLFVDEAEVGRWPNTLFTRLNSNASFISFGGRAEFLRGAGAGAGGPPMGNGHFPGDVSSSASIKKLQIFDNGGSFVDFKLGEQAAKTDARECYDAIMMPDDGGKGGFNFSYGGPSGCKNYN